MRLLLHDGPLQWNSKYGDELDGFTGLLSGIVPDQKHNRDVCIGGFGVTIRKMSDYVFINTETFFPSLLPMSTPNKRDTTSVVSQDWNG